MTLSTTFLVPCTEPLVWDASHRQQCSTWLYFVISLSPLNNSSLSHSDHSSLSTSLCSPPLSLPNPHLFLLLQGQKARNFVLQFSAAAQDQVLDETPVLEAEPLEFSNTRLLAQNVPWHCTPEDIRTVFEKYGTVFDVELAMYDKTRNRGLAFVTMSSPKEARTALDNLESSSNKRKSSSNISSPIQVKIDFSEQEAARQPLSPLRSNSPNYRTYKK